MVPICSFSAYSGFYVTVLSLITTTSLFVSVKNFRQLVRVQSGFSILDPEVSLLSSGMRLRKWIMATTVFSNGIQCIAGLAEVIAYLSTYKTTCEEEEIAAILTFEGSSSMSRIILACRIIPSAAYVLLFGLLTGYFIHICHSLKAVTLIFIAGKVVGDVGLVFLFFSTVFLGFLVMISILRLDGNILFLSTCIASFALLIAILWYTSVIYRYLRTNNFLAGSARLVERLYIVMIADAVSLLGLTVFYFYQYYTELR